MDNNHQNTARNRIKVVLTEKNMTSRWLAEKLGKSENTISRWCSNKIQPSLNQLFQIAELLDTDVRKLIISTKNKYTLRFINDDDTEDIMDLDLDDCKTDAEAIEETYSQIDLLTPDWITHVLQWHTGFTAELYRNETLLKTVGCDLATTLDEFD